MSSWNKWLWGGLGWAVGGPIGGVVGFALGAIVGEAAKDKGSSYFSTTNSAHGATMPGDFGVALLILYGAVMKSDDRIMKSELDYVKKFFVKQFGEAHTQERMILFKQILKQDSTVGNLCQW